MYLGEKDKNPQNKENSTKLTRKQALLVVLETATDKEAIAVIQDMVENMPYHEWDSATIDVDIEQYKFGHGRYPKLSNFVYDKTLPNPPTLLYRTGIPLKDYLKRFYTKQTNSVKYFDKPKEEWLKLFQSEFDRIHLKGAIDYNTRRDKSTLLWSVIAGMFDKNKWNELLIIVEREVKRQVSQKSVIMKEVLQ